MIEESLKSKISSNEKKIKSLFTLKQKSKNKITQKINPSKKLSKLTLMNKELRNKPNISKEKLKINSFIINKENNKNLVNLELNPILKTNINISKNILINNEKEKFDSFTKPSLKNKKYKPKIKYKELECFINIKNKNNNILGQKPKKESKTKDLSNSLSLPNKQEKARRNIFQSKTNLSNLDYTKNFSKSFDFNLTYERFIENETKKKERISKLKKKREKFEKKIYPHQPKINEKSKELTKSITDDFLIRLEKYKKDHIEKEENLKLSVMKYEEEKINKNNFLKLYKKRSNDSIDKSSNRTIIITESVNKLYDWDKKRKEKIENEIKRQDLIEKNGHVPKINKNYQKKDKIIQKIFDRLYNKNQYVFEFKKEILTQESTPKFQSLLNKDKNKVNISFNYSNNNAKYDNKDSTFNNNEDDKLNNNTDRIFNRKNKPDNKEQNKNIIVVIRKVKSQIDIINKKNK